MDKFELPYLNRVSITGRVARDPEFRQTNSGQAVCNFRIVSHKRYHDVEGKPKEETCYVGVAAWHSLAESCKESLLKGSAVQIEGELKSRVRDSNDGVRRSFVEIRAHRIQLYRNDGSLEELTGDRMQSASAMAVPNRAEGDYQSRQEDSPFRIRQSRPDGFEPATEADIEEL